MTRIFEHASLFGYSNENIQNNDTCILTVDRYIAFCNDWNLLNYLIRKTEEKTGRTCVRVGDLIFEHVLAQTCECQSQIVAVLSCLNKDSFICLISIIPAFD